MFTPEAIATRRKSNRTLLNPNREVVLCTECLFGHHLFVGMGNVPAYAETLTSLLLGGPLVSPLHSESVSGRRFHDHAHSGRRFVRVQITF